jgi:hypothetical protein
MMDASLKAPLRHAAFEEYKRAFDHCFGLAVYKSVSGDRLIDVDECRTLRWDNPKKLPPLDEDELA